MSFGKCHPKRYIFRVIVILENLSTALDLGNSYSNLNQCEPEGGFETGSYADNIVYLILAETFVPADIFDASKTHGKIRIPFWSCGLV